MRVPTIPSVQARWVRCDLWRFGDPPRVAVVGSPRWLLVLVRLAYLAVGNVFAALRLIPMGEREKDIEILVLRRQLGPARVRFAPEDRALLAALLAGHHVGPR